jgi:hypothetical protein
MKTVRYIYLATITICILSSFRCKAQTLQANVQNEIIGIWIAEDDLNVKLVFTSDNKILDYYDNELTDTFTFSISHQCGSESDNNAWFLKMRDNEDLSERCYEIYGANDNGDKILSIRDLVSGKIFLYNKQ